MMVPQTSQSEIEAEQIQRNLTAWADITAICIELRKAVLKTQYGIEDDAELTRMVFTEAVARKEAAWDSIQP